MEINWRSNCNLPTDINVLGLGGHPNDRSTKDHNAASDVSASMKADQAFNSGENHRKRTSEIDGGIEPTIKRAVGRPRDDLEERIRNAEDEIEELNQQIEENQETGLPPDERLTQQLAEAKKERTKAKNALSKRKGYENKKKQDKSEKETTVNTLQISETRNLEKHETMPNNVVPIGCLDASLQKKRSIEDVNSRSVGISSIARKIDEKVWTGLNVNEIPWHSGKQNLDYKRSTMDNDNTQDGNPPDIYSPDIDDQQVHQKFPNHPDTYNYRTPPCNLGVTYPPPKFEKYEPHISRQRGIENDGGVQIHTENVDKLLYSALRLLEKNDNKSSHIEESNPKCFALLCKENIWCKKCFYEENKLPKYLPSLDLSLYNKDWSMQDMIEALQQERRSDSCPYCKESLFTKVILSLTSFSNSLLVKPPKIKRFPTEPLTFTGAEMDPAYAIVEVEQKLVLMQMTKDFWEKMTQREGWVPAESPRSALLIVYQKRRSI